MVNISPVSLQEREKKFLKRHPVAAPIATTAVAAGIGAGLGRLLPIDANLFIHYTKLAKADEFLQNAHKANSEGNKAEAGKQLVGVLKILGSEAFEKLANSDFNDEQITELGKSITDLEVEESINNFAKEMMKDYAKFLKKDPEILEKYKSQIKKMHDAKAKLLATIAGLSTLVVTGVYSYYHNRFKKNKFL